MTISKSPCDRPPKPQPFLLGGIPDEEHGTLLVSKDGLAQLARWEMAMIARDVAADECLEVKP